MEIFNRIVVCAGVNPAHANTVWQTEGGTDVVGGGGEFNHNPRVGLPFKCPYPNSNGRFHLNTLPLRMCRGGGKGARCRLKKKKS